MPNANSTNCVMKMSDADKITDNSGGKKEKGSSRRRRSSSSDYPVSLKHHCLLKYHQTMSLPICCKTAIGVCAGASGLSSALGLGMAKTGLGAWGLAAASLSTGVAVGASVLVVGSYVALLSYNKCGSCCSCHKRRMTGHCKNTQFKEVVVV